MSDERVPAPDDEPAGGADERRFFEAVREAARSDAPPSDLAERVLDGLEYRLRLAETPDSARRAKWRGRELAWLALFASAAGVAFFVRQRGELPQITPEPTQAPAAKAPEARPAELDPCRERGVAAGNLPLIDDFEDGDDAISPLEQRAGFWRWVRETDAPGTAPALLPVPRPEPAPRDKLALHVKGGRLVDWGAAVEFHFRPTCYDATKYAGVAFQARGPGRVYVSPREVGVIPIAEGGLCEKDCYNAHVSKIDLDARWKRYEVRWEDVRQRGFDRPPLDPSRLNSFAFLIHPEDAPYDLWLDDVRFLQRQ